MCSNKTVLFFLLIFSLVSEANGAAPAHGMNLDLFSLPAGDHVYISKDDFALVLTEAEDAFRPLADARHETLGLYGDWDDTTPDALARR